MKKQYVILIIIFFAFIISWCNNNSIDKKSCFIKGNISYKTKEKIYHIPWCENYHDTEIDLNKWEKWFCSEKDAIAAWRRKAKNCP